jgi:DNA-directed RNA polymerase specialized sigma24 family protein
VAEDFVALYELHYPRVVRAVELAGAARHEAEDVAQEAFVRTLARWRWVRRGPSPAGYVYRVAFRLGRRPRGREVPLDEQGAGAVTGRNGGGAAGGDLAEGVATQLDVLAALEAMPARRRSCAVACLVVGMTPKEAGHALGIAASTVRKQLERARAELSGALAEGIVRDGT